MKERKVKTETVVNNFIDTDTGELLNTEEHVKHHKIVVDDSTSFAIMYSEVIGALKGLRSNDMHIVQYCVLNAEVNSNTVNLTKPMCDKITETCDIPYQSIKNSIAKLKTKGLLIPLGSGNYRVNPKYYWRGNKIERNKTLKYVLEVECPNCE